MKLNVAYDFLPKQRSLHTSLVMDHFGVQFDHERHVIAEEVELSLQPGQVVLFIGPSGSGKSSLLRATQQALAQQGQRVLEVERLTWPMRPLVDAFDQPLSDVLPWLSGCGLGEAQLMLRTPQELSEGQRYRFKLALGLSRLARQAAGQSAWLAADEFTATLDRVLAQVVAYNVQRLARKQGLGLLLATTHEDVQMDLQPEVIVRCDLQQPVQVEHAGKAAPPVPRQPIHFFPLAG